MEKTMLNQPITTRWARLNRVAGNIRKTNLRSRFVGTIKPFEGFSATASYSYEFVDELREKKPVFIDQWNFYNETVTWTNRGKTNIMNYDGKVERFFGDVVLRYENVWQMTG